MMFMGEILAFPSGRKLSVKQADPKGIQKKLHEDAAKATADDYVIGFIQSLEDLKIKIYDRDMKEFGLFVEALKGLTYKLYGLDHPMHMISDKMMTVEKDKSGKTVSRIHYKIPVDDEKDLEVNFEGEELHDTD